MIKIIEEKYNTILDYYSKIESKNNITSLFHSEAEIYSYSRGKLSVDDYNHVIDSQTENDTDVNIVSINQAGENVFTAYLYFIFDNDVTRHYVNVFEFLDGKIIRLYLNRLTNQET